MIYRLLEQALDPLSLTNAYRSAGAYILIFNCRTWLIEKVYKLRIVIYIMKQGVFYGEELWLRCREFEPHVN